MINLGGHDQGESLDKAFSEQSSARPTSTPEAAATTSARRLQWQSITKPLARWRDRSYRQAFGRHLRQQLQEDEGFQQAGVLSYTSLLAVVPLMAVVLGVVSAFPVFENWSVTIQDFVFQNFVPAAGETVQQHLQQFVGNARVLTGPGALFLVITALLLMSNVERAFNRIWRVEQARPWGSRLLVYWAMLTLAPMLLGGSLALTSVIAGWQGQEAYGWFNGLLGWLLRRAPFFVALVGFSLLYFVVPNRRSPLRFAVAGGVLAALLFEAAKLGFVWYVRTFPTYEKLYGALAVVPIFLLWIYVTWLVTLMAAGFSAALSRFRYEPKQECWDRRFDLVVAYRSLLLLWRAQCEGRGFSDTELLRALPMGASGRLPEVLDALMQARWVRRTEDDELVLAVDSDAVTMGQLYRLAPFAMPLSLSGHVGDDAAGRAFIDAMADLGEQADVHLERSLKQYFQGSVTP
jgi:membrane protein